MLRTDLRGRFASVRREAGSEDCFSYTAPQCAARTIASRRADTSPESSLQRFSAFTAKCVGHHHVGDFWRSPRRRQGSRSARPALRAAGLDDDSVERTEGSYVMAGVTSVSVRIVACADERRRPAAGSWTFTRQRRILAAATGHCATSRSTGTYRSSGSRAQEHVTAARCAAS